MTEFMRTYMGKQIPMVVAYAGLVPVLIAVLFAESGTAIFLFLSLLSLIVVATILQIRLEKKKKKNSNGYLICENKPSDKIVAKVTFDRSFHCLSRFPMTISVDNVETLTIGSGGSVETEIPAGEHKITVACADLEIEEMTEISGNSLFYVWFTRGVKKASKPIELSVIKGNLESVMSEEITALNRFEFITFGSLVAAFLLIVVPIQIIIWVI